MSRKVHIEGEAIVLVPVKFNFNGIIRINEGANLSVAMRNIAAGRHTPTADVELLEVEEIKSIGGISLPNENDDANAIDSMELEDALNTACNESMGKGFQLLDCVALDSK